MAPEHTGRFYYFLDKKAERSWLWVDLNLRNYSMDPEPRPRFLLVHTTDLAGVLTAHSETPVQFENRLRVESGGHVAFLYISGGADVWDPLKRDEEPVGPWTRVHGRPVENDDVRFQRRLKRLLWDLDQQGDETPPNWDLLSKDWALEALDCLIARQTTFGEGPDSPTDETVRVEGAFGEGYDSEIRYLSLTADQRKVFDAVRDPHAPVDQVDKAIALLRRLQGDPT